VALNELLNTMMETDFTNDVKEMPVFMYEYNGKQHRYYPDIYIPSQKRIVEVKSTYTYTRQMEQNECKKKHVIQDGYAFEFWICDTKQILEKK
jgi:hypothetical protein